MNKDKNSKSRTIFVTGGAGFIGSLLIDNLLKKGDNIVCIDNLNEFYNPNIKKLNQVNHYEYDHYEFYEGDILDEGLVKSIFKKHDIEIVIHLAAMPGVRPSISNPSIYTEVNIIGTRIILDAMVESNVEKMIFASSSSVYGNNKKIPFREDDSVDRPISPYAATKKMGELLCHAYHHIYELNISLLRFFTVYGPRQRPEMAIHQFIRNALKGEPIIVFGDGSTARDYTYIDDIIYGIIQSIESDDRYMIYNLGNSEPIKLSNLISIIAETTGINPILEYQEIPQGDVFQTYADINRARNNLKYDPKTGIQDGISKFVKWYISMKNVHEDVY
jgi:UDP-glucuronate 4-epimerase